MRLPFSALFGRGVFHGISRALKLTDQAMNELPFSRGGFRQ